MNNIKNCNQTFVGIKVFNFNATITDGTPENIQHFKIYLGGSTTPIIEEKKIGSNFEINNIEIDQFTITNQHRVMDNISHNLVTRFDGTVKLNIESIATRGNQKKERLKSTYYFDLTIGNDGRVINCINNLSNTEIDYQKLCEETLAGKYIDTATEKKCKSLAILSNNLTLPSHVVSPLNTSTLSIQKGMLKIGTGTFSEGKLIKIGDPAYFDSNITTFGGYIANYGSFSPSVIKHKQYILYKFDYTIHASTASAVGSVSLSSKKILATKLVPIANDLGKDGLLWLEKNNSPESIWTASPPPFVIHNSKAYSCGTSASPATCDYDTNTSDLIPMGTIATSTPLFQTLSQFKNWHDFSFSYNCSDVIDGNIQKLCSRSWAS